MTRKTHFTRTASSAIAAALVFGSTGAMAQAVGVPNVVAPPAAQAAPSAPPQSQPAPQPEMVSRPVVQNVPVAVVPPELPQTETAAAAPSTPPAARSAAPTSRTAAPAANLADTAPPPVAAAEQQIGTAQTAEAQSAPVAVPVNEAASPVVADPAATPAGSADFALMTTILAALGVGALAVWGFVTIGRRRGRVPVVERSVVANTAVEPVLAVEPAIPAASFTATPLATTSARAAWVAHAGASVPLPRKRPEGFDERNSLLRRMVEAKPDRANPFVSPKARLRRARLILQSLDHDFAGRETWIDFSQYPGNWPSSGNNASAAA